MQMRQRRHQFLRSEIVVQLAEDGTSYGLFPAKRPPRSGEPAATEGPTPDVLLSGYSGFPAEAPGWLVASGAPPSSRIKRIEAAVTGTGQQRPAESEWEPVDWCVLGDAVWAAEVATHQVHLRMTTNESTTVWYRPNRVFPT